MRIISGKYKGRRLESPGGLVTRPLPDRVRESLFNLLRGHFDGESVLDLFSGTGSFGLEAASRGAARVVMVEQNRQVARVLQGNIDSLGAQDACEVVINDAFGPAALNRCPKPVHIVLLDPPYPLIKQKDGWERCRRQTERLISMLDDTGFLLLRTPWPFWHLETEEPEEEAPAHGRGRRRGEEDLLPRKGTARHEVIDESSTARQLAELDEAEGLRDDEAGDGTDAGTGERAMTESPEDQVRIPADLTFPNAEGPETHVYKNTAVHFYMRADRKRPEPADQTGEQDDEEE